MFCPKCGNELVEGARFCNKCGSGLYAEDRPERGLQEDDFYEDVPGDDSGYDLDYEEQETGKRKYFLVALLLVLILAAATAIFFVLKKGGGPGGPSGSSSGKKKEKSAEATTATVQIQPVEMDVTEEEATEATTLPPEEEPTEVTTEEKFNALDMYKKEADIEDYLEYDGHIYLIYNFHELGLDSFSECEDYCEERGGHLAVINSEEENYAIYSYLLEKDRDHTFFGFTDRGDEGDWEWVDGSPVTYTNWASGQPNNKGGGEDYAQFNGKNSGSWNDARFGSESWRFLCEWDSEF